MGNELSQNPNATRRIGNYELRVVKKIGEGGYSFVFLVEDVNTGRHYALKRCITSDRDGSAQIEREIAIIKQLSALKHPHFMQYITHDSVATSGGGNEYYILTEFCSGGSLISEIQAYLDRKQLFPEAKMIVVLESIFKALHAMHTLPTPTAHRDIKLENVLRTANGIYKLCDFGSTSAMNKVITDSSEMKQEESIINKYSTEMYRSPELCDLYRARNNNWVIGPKADVWAVGNILYTLAYQCHPFEDGGHMAVLSGRITFPDPTKERKYAIYSPYVNYVISQCFTMNPNNRKTAEDMLKLLHSWSVYLKSNRTQHGDPSIADEVMTWVPRVINDSKLPQAPPPRQQRAQRQQQQQQRGPVQKPPQQRQPIQHQQQQQQQQQQSSQFEEILFDVEWSDDDDDGGNGDGRNTTSPDTTSQSHASLALSPPPMQTSQSQTASFTSPVRRGMNTNQSSASSQSQLPIKGLPLPQKPFQSRPIITPPPTQPDNQAVSDTLFQLNISPATITQIPPQAPQQRQQEESFGFDDDWCDFESAFDKATEEPTNPALSSIAGPPSASGNTTHSQQQGQSNSQQKMSTLFDYSQPLPQVPVALHYSSSSNQYPQQPPQPPGQTGGTFFEAMYDQKPVKQQPSVNHISINPNLTNQPLPPPPLSPTPSASHPQTPHSDLTPTAFSSSSASSYHSGNPFGAVYQQQQQPYNQSYMNPYDTPTTALAPIVPTGQAEYRPTHKAPAGPAPPIPPRPAMTEFDRLQANPSNPYYVQQQSYHHRQKQQQPDFISGGNI